MRSIIRGVYIITASSGSTLGGMAASWVSQASFSPPLFMVSIGPSRHTHKVISEGKNFCINIMPESGIAMAKRFGTTTGSKVDKFSGTPYHKAVTGAPVLDNAVAYIDCKVVQSIPAGDHTIFVGEVAEAKVTSTEPPAVYRHNDFF